MLLTATSSASLFLDDKTSTVIRFQALDRLDPVLPLSPGRAERHGFEYYRHGTLSLYAALNVKTGSVRKAKWARQIHIVLDNLSAHKTSAVR